MCVGASVSGVMNICMMGGILWAPVVFSYPPRSAYFCTDSALCVCVSVRLLSLAY